MGSLTFSCGRLTPLATFIEIVCDVISAGLNVTTCVLLKIFVIIV